MTNHFQVALLSLVLAKSAFAQSPNYLFVGNSYTGQNGLANVFDSIIENGIPEWKDQVFSRALQQGGRTLGSHLMDADGTNGDKPLRQALVTEPIPWNWVTLQDQSQVPGFYDYNWEGTEYWRSTQAAIQLNDMIDDLGGQTMFFMTWGRRDGDNGNSGLYPDFLTMQDKLEEGYRQYQEATTTPSRPTYIAPVGLVFKTIYMDELNAGNEPPGQDSLFRALYRGDGSHPSVWGTYVAALTLYSSMTGNSPVLINWWPEEVPEDTARRLQDAVSRTILETFDSGEIDYPFTVPFEAGTTPPETSTPTVAQDPPTPVPVTASPTASPTISPPINPAPTPPYTGNMGSLTITFIYDEYPEEVSWTLAHEGSDNPLFFQPYGLNIQPHSTAVKTFNNLKPGEEYTFRVSDSEGDGICCSEGQGKFKIKDNVQDRNLYTIKGKFKSFFEITFFVQPNGHAKPTHRSQHYRPGTWEDLETLIAPNDNGWPGAMPSRSMCSVMINIDIDDNPEELSWTLYRGAGMDQSWTVISTWDGKNAAPRTLDSTEFSALQRGWYRLIVQDAAGNGNCCDFGRGFVSVTGPLESQNGTMGLVWGNNGQFESQEEILFFIGVSGHISHMRRTTEE